MTGNGNYKFEFVRRSTRQNMADLEAGRGCPCKDTRQASELPFQACSCEFELGMLSGCCFHTLDRSRSRVS